MQICACLGGRQPPSTSRTPTFESTRDVRAENSPAPFGDRLQQPVAGLRSGGAGAVVRRGDRQALRRLPHRRRDYITVVAACCVCGGDPRHREPRSRLAAVRRHLPYRRPWLQRAHHWRTEFCDHRPAPNGARMADLVRGQSVAPNRGLPCTTVLVLLRDLFPDPAVVPIRPAEALL